MILSIKNTLSKWSNIINFTKKVESDTYLSEEEIRDRLNKLIKFDRDTFFEFSFKYVGTVFHNSFEFDNGSYSAAKSIIKVKGTFFSTNKGSAPLFFYRCFVPTGTSVGLTSNKSTKPIRFLKLYRFCGNTWRGEY